ncbi:MAG: LysR family transcriptional regulator [Paracoccaceae bacterium]|nr:LysR family transcriptional regulator [Paracoccaceae bacterium]
MHRDNWDDLRFVLAVAETGSVSAAARSLGVNHATVLRRVGAFEERHGMLVFERTPTGYAVPRDRLRLIEAAREAEAAHLAVARLVAGARAPLAGAVRVTSTDTFCLAVLPQALMRLRAEAPELRIDLLCSNAHADLSRIEAEIAVRPALKLPEDLAGEAAAELGFAAYAPASDPGTAAWLGLSGPLTRSTRVAEWLKENVAPSALTGGADSFVILREMAAAGQGKAILPCVLGDGDPRLKRLEGQLPDIAVPVWVASHADLADAPRLAAVRARLAEALRADAARLKGR